MQLKPLILIFSTFVGAFTGVVIIPADSLPCTPSVDPSTCLLNYRTNSGAPLDVVNPKISASAFIYSSSCLTLGHKSVTVPGETRILSWGLSFKKPLLLGSEKRDNLPWWTPWFTYDGRRYAYEDCSCQGLEVSGEHGCSCQFRCKLFVMDYIGS